MGQLMIGKLVADAITSELKKKVDIIISKGISPKLTIVRAGGKSNDLAYEKGAVKRCQSIGIIAEIKEYAENISQEDFISELRKINNDRSVNGILVFRPLPKQLSESIMKYIIAPEKDVDCFSPVNVAKVMEKDQTGFPPCTPSAVMELLKFYDVPIKGKNAVVIGRSMVVGKPVSMLLLNENATVTICHSKTEKLKDICSRADILVAAMGRAEMIDSHYIKPGAVVIDVGINTDKNGNLRGDVLTEDCIKKALMITPVPGGVGSVTTSILARNVVKACMQQNCI